MNAISWTSLRDEPFEILDVDDSYKQLHNDVYLKSIELIWSFLEIISLNL